LFSIRSSLMRERCSARLKAVLNMGLSETYPDSCLAQMYEAILALHDPALWIGEVFLRLGVRRGGGRSGRPAAFAPSLCLSLRGRLSLLFELGFGRGLRL
jgi:hypothetical protein